MVRYDIQHVVWYLNGEPFCLEGLGTDRCAISLKVQDGIAVVHVGLRIQLLPELSQFLHKLAIIIHRATLVGSRSLLLDEQAGTAAVTVVIGLEVVLATESGGKRATQEENGWELHGGV